MPISRIPVLISLRKRDRSSDLRNRLGSLQRDVLNINILLYTMMAASSA